MMRHVVSRYPWAVEICGPFLHPIQPLAHEGLAQHILFDIHKMVGPIEHGECRSGVVVQQIPGVRYPQRWSCRAVSMSVGPPKAAGSLSTSKEKGLASSSRSLKMWSASWTSASMSRTASTTVGVCTTMRPATGPSSATSAGSSTSVVLGGRWAYVGSAFTWGAQSSTPSIDAALW
jgi:hypothetical protein